MLKHRCFAITYCNNIWASVSKTAIIFLQDFIYPEDVAYPIGGPGNPQYVVIEMHYDNPDRDDGKFIVSHPFVAL